VREVQNNVKANSKTYLTCRSPLRGKDILKRLEKKNQTKKNRSRSARCYGKAGQQEPEAHENCGIQFENREDKGSQTVRSQTRIIDFDSEKLTGWMRISGVCGACIGINGTLYLRPGLTIVSALC